MIQAIRESVVRLLRWSERYAKTDMLYIAESGFWMNLTSILLSFFSFLLYIVFANVLSKETYGMYQYFLSLSAIISSFTLTGMNFAVMQAVPRGYDGTFRASVGMQIRFGIIALAVSCFAALYYLVQGNLLIANGLILIGLFVPFVHAFNTFGAYLVGKKMFKEIFVYNMYLYVPLYALLALSAVLYASPLLLIAINLGVQALLLALIYWSILKKTHPSDATDPEALRYGKRLSMINFLGSAVGQIDNVLAFHFLGPVPLAIYSFATAIPDRIGGLLKFIHTAALPKFSVRSADDIRRSITGKVIRVGLLTLCAAGAYAILAPFIFNIFFPAYESSIYYSQLYALTILAYAGNIWVAAILSQRFTREYAIFNISTSIAQTIIQFVGIIFYGLMGLVVAKIISSLLSGAVAGVLFMFRRD